MVGFDKCNIQRTFGSERGIPETVMNPCPEEHKIICGF